MHSQTFKKDIVNVVRTKEDCSGKFEIGIGEFKISRIDEAQKQEKEYLAGTETSGIIHINDTLEECKTELFPLISNIISDMKIPASLIGYRYIRYAIVLCIHDEDYINSITKELYPAVAKEFKTTPSRVERAIRHSIDRCWTEYLTMPGNFHPYVKALLSTFYRKPTNSEFLALISDRLKYSYINIKN